jgi:hypothetical protein
MLAGGIPFAVRIKYFGLHHEASGLYPLSHS